MESIAVGRQVKPPETSYNWEQAIEIYTSAKIQKPINYLIWGCPRVAPFFLPVTRKGVIKDEVGDNWYRNDSSLNGLKPILAVYYVL